MSSERSGQHGAAPLNPAGAGFDADHVPPPAHTLTPISPSTGPLPEDVALSVRDVSKCYDIYARPFDRLKQAFMRSRQYKRQFWALRHVSFDVRRGEAVGIIGRNGSGKSTLMQVIAGTLAPTAGEVHVRGKVAALLELGSGFNPHFTGRENIYLSGAIRGFSAREMDARVEEVAEFAEIGEFLDQPVQVYSSGMHARLAFAVATTVEPEILILDEILSVGDAGFQQRCIGRLRAMLDRGVTLLFVSHNADAIKSICSKGLFLLKGRPAFFGASESAVDHYLSHVRGSTTQRALTKQPTLADSVEVAESVPASLRYGSGHAQVEQVRLLDTGGRLCEHFKFGERITIEATIRAFADLERLDLIFSVRDKAGVDLFGGSIAGAGPGVRPLPTMTSGDAAVVRFTFENNLHPGGHGICLSLTRRPDEIGDGRVTLDHLDSCAAFVSMAPADLKVRGKYHHPVAASWERIEAASGGLEQPRVTVRVTPAKAS